MMEPASSDVKAAAHAMNDRGHGLDFGNIYVYNFIAICGGIP
jgi:hypothetical protein